MPIRYPQPHQQYQRKQMRGKHANKFHAQKVTVDGITFDSKVESYYWYFAKQEYANNDKVTIKYHDHFIISEGFKLAGKQHAARKYTPDFTFYEDGMLVKVVDVKGGRATMTDGSSLRIFFFEKKYQIPVTIATYDKSNNTFIEHDK